MSSERVRTVSAGELNGPNRMFVHEVVEVAAALATWRALQHSHANPQGLAAATDMERLQREFDHQGGSVNRFFTRMAVVVTSIAIVVGFCGPAQAIAKRDKRCNRYVCATFKVTTAGREITVHTSIVKNVKMYTCDAAAGDVRAPQYGGDAIAGANLDHRTSVTYKFTGRRSVTYMFVVTCTTPAPAWDTETVFSRIRVKL